LNQVICDLDGVIYRGQVPIPGSAEGLRRLVGSANDVFFVTNNSTRTPETGARKITVMTGVPVSPDRLITSSVAAASILSDRDDPVLIVGEEGVYEAVRGAGRSLTEDPGDARSVVVGLTRSLTYDLVAAAATSVRNGARFIATNVDPTFPTEGGLIPGSGAIVAAISTAAGRMPEIAGKPHAPMRALIRSRGVSPNAWVIGDRVDTDIALAQGEPGWRTVLVLTGVTTEAEAVLSGADFIVDDFAAAVDLVLADPDKS